MVGWPQYASAQNLIQSGNYLRPPPQRGSHTVLTKSAAPATYDSNATQAQKMGSSLQGLAVQSKKGFGCSDNKIWTIVKGQIQCAGQLDLAEGAAGLLVGGKTLYVRALLVDGFRTGVVIRVTGSSSDLRVDMFALNGGVVGSCYVTATEPGCHLGSPNDTHPGLAAVPKFPTADGQTRYASEMVGGNLVFAGSRVGGSMQDAYIASITSSQLYLDFHFVGLHHLDGSQGNNLRPIYSWGRLSWSALSAALGTGSDVTWITTSAWNANTITPGQ
jgi:hypothetical protein